jgi:exopolysaccharide biosynthesis polyprenyl glycosylphosphotransferase
VPCQCPRALPCGERTWFTLFSLPAEDVTEILGVHPPPTIEGAGQRPPPNGRSTPRRRAGVRWPAAAIIDDLAAGRLLTPVISERQARSTEAATYLRFTRISDTSIALITLLSLFILDNLGGFPQGWTEFLNARLTVQNLGLLTCFAGVWYLTFTALRLYEWKVVKVGLREMARVYAATAIGASVALIFPLMSDSGAFRYGVVLLFFITASTAVLVARLAIRVATTSRADEVQNIVIVGSGPRAAQMYRQLCQDGSPRRHVLGFFDSTLANCSDEDVILRLAGSLDDLERFLMDEAVDEVVIALPVKSRYADVQAAIQICERVGTPITYPADIFTHVRTAPRLQTNGLAPVIAFTHLGYGPWFWVKRGVDLVGALLGLILLSPLMLLTAVAIKATSPGPVLFAQVRCGRNKRRFTMLKFRTMVEDAEIRQRELEAHNEATGPMFKIRSDPRVTRVGAFLRRSSIDELPQLWNVLRGNMSLVGPRPLPLRDVQRFSDSWLMRRFSVLPGITGLWQVSGRSALANRDDWIALDLAYVDRWSLWLDLEILAMTVPAVLTAKGAS